MRPDPSAGGRRRAGPLQRRAVPGRGDGHRRHDRGGRLAGDHHPARRRLSGAADADGRRGVARGRGGGGARHGCAARHRGGHVGRRRARPHRRGAVRARGLPLAAHRRRAPARARDGPPQGAGDRADEGRRPHRGAARRARDHAGPAARRRLRDLRGPPHGDRRRDHRPARPRRAGGRRRHHAEDPPRLRGVGAAAAPPRAGCGRGGRPVPGGWGAPGHGAPRSPRGQEGTSW